MRDHREGDLDSDRWRMWRVTEPEPEFLRSRTRRARPRVDPSAGELPFRRWWHV